MFIHRWSALAQACVLALVAQGQSGSKKPDPPPQQERPDSKASSEPLHETRWAIDVLAVPVAGKRVERSFTDTLVFSRNLLRSLHFRFRGFADSPYRIRSRKGTLRLRAEQQSRDGRLVWRARVSIGAGRIAGTLEWTRKDKSVSRYTFVGSRGTALEGTIWSAAITLRAADGEDDELRWETMTFRRGRMAVSGWFRIGFLPGNYALERISRGWRLRCVVMSPQHGRQRWDLRIENDALRGTLVWEQEEGTSSYRVRGRRIAPKR